MTVSIARILFNSVLSPRYSVLMRVLTSTFIIPCSIFVIRFSGQRLDCPPGPCACPPSSPVGVSGGSFNEA